MIEIPGLPEERLLESMARLRSIRISALRKASDLMTYNEDDSPFYDDLDRRIVQLHADWDEAPRAVTKSGASGKGRGAPCRRHS